jgi:hypothetical protein
MRRVSLSGVKKERRKNAMLTVPTAKNTPTAEEDDEEAELRKLQAEMAM